MPAATLQKRLDIQAVELSKPGRRIRNDRLEQDAFGHFADTDFIALKPELARQADCLAAAVTKKLGDSRLCHLGRF